MKKSLILVHLPLYYEFYKMKKRKQELVTTGCKYMPRFIFCVSKQILATSQASGIFLASYFGWENKYQLRVYLTFHILGGKIGTCNQPGLRYMPSFIFQVEKQVLATGYATCIRCASYFGQKNRYELQIHIAPHVLSE